MSGCSLHGDEMMQQMMIIMMITKHANHTDHENLSHDSPSFALPQKDSCGRNILTGSCQDCSQKQSSKSPTSLFLRHTSAHHAHRSQTHHQHHHHNNKGPKSSAT